MTGWEADPDAWKEEEQKPWEGSDAWKLEDGYKPGETEAARNPKVNRSLEVTLGVRPTVAVKLLEWNGTTPQQILVKNRDALKLVAEIADGQKALTDEGELYQYSGKRNMWVRIPWEAVS